MAVVEQHDRDHKVIIFLITAPMSVSIRAEKEDEYLHPS